MKLKEWFSSLEEHIIALLLLLMVIVIFLATGSRYLGIGSMTWGEEFARYAMVWMTYLGLGVAAKKKAHFSVTAFISFFPKNFQKIIRVYQLLVVTAFSVIIVILSSKIVYLQFGMSQTSPAMYLPMWFIYSAIPLGSLLLMFRFAQSVFNYKSNY
ncbi:MAG: hypothetical protein APF76_07115 [Desulfitibacter sp. BRH_c19]|nr:MAG: hypothetical protein APF76_07115 [Desulfitibacter sp. BRH_c19]